MDRFRTACALLAHQWKRLELPITTALGPGLSQANIVDQFRGFAGQMPEEVCALYQWHNGSGDEECFPGTRWLSLEQALCYVRQQRHLATGRAPRRQRPADPYWPPQWLPIFGDVIGDSECYVVSCPTSPQHDAPVYYVSCDEDDTLYLAYDSLTQMLETLATCYETGAYWVDVSPLDGQRRVFQHREQVAQITLAQNPQRTAWWLAQVPGAQTVEDLAACVEQPYGNVWLAIHFLRDPRLVPPLIAVLHGGSLEARCTAARLLGELADPRGIAPLLTALQDPHGPIRLAAVRALELMRTPQDIGDDLLALKHPQSAGAQVDGLLKALQDQESNVRQAAAHALGTYGDPRAVTALVASLQEQDPEVRHQAAYALRAIGDARAIEALVQALDDAEPAVVQEAAIALASLGATQAVPSLLALLADPTGPLTSRLGAVLALGHLRAAAAVPACIEALDSSESSLRRRATIALGQIGDVCAVDALIRALDDPVEIVRCAAIEALGALGDGRAVAPLTRLAHDPACRLRGTAQDALTKLEAPQGHRSGDETA